ncbi:MAG: RNA 2'-phosphotransferase [Clostridiales bacterium]|nr:RNA 2'-phosphotransferase [Clostridiales bacterium]
MSDKLSKYLCYLLRHHPEKARLDIDLHGWVDVNQLIENVNQYSAYSLDMDTLKNIVAEDAKGRYRLSDDHRRIKCCQGHTIPWIEPELTYGTPPKYLYHGTTTAAAKKIDASGAILKMKRHHVHTQPVEAMAWQSARRWHLTPVVLKIDAEAMAADGYLFGRSDNDVWCVECVPTKYICDRLYEPTI